MADFEKCDDGNLENGDGCSSVCQIETGYVCFNSPSDCSTNCGDSIAIGEECEDKNDHDNDGCSSKCKVESGWTCTKEVPALCTTTCGDGIRAGQEECDGGI